MSSVLEVGVLTRDHDDRLARRHAGRGGVVAGLERRLEPRPRQSVDRTTWPQTRDRHLRAAGDHHSIPLAILGDILRGRGLELVDLGATHPRHRSSTPGDAHDDVLTVAIGVGSDDSIESRDTSRHCSTTSSRASLSSSAARPSPAKARHAHSVPTNTERPRSTSPSDASSSRQDDADARARHGASGYVGGRLVPELLARGHVVRCVVRDPRKLDTAPWHPDVEIVRAECRRRPS